jgi:hypothetical protein
LELRVSVRGKQENKQEYLFHATTIQSETPSETRYKLSRPNIVCGPAIPSIVSPPAGVTVTLFPLDD